MKHYILTVVVTIFIGCNQYHIDKYRIDTANVLPVLTDEEIINHDCQTLDIVFSTHDDSDNVRHSIILPKNAEFGSKITWDTTKHDGVNEDGSINRPSEGSDNLSGGITAVLEYKDKIKYKDFYVTVLKRVSDPLIYDIEWLDDKIISGNNKEGLNLVTDNLYLPDTGAEQSVIEWNTDEHDAVTPDGIITPSIGNDISGRIYACLTNNNKKLTKEFAITVLQKSKANVYLTDISPLSYENNQSLEVFPFIQIKISDANKMQDFTIKSSIDDQVVSILNSDEIIKHHPKNTDYIRIYPSTYNKAIGRVSDRLIIVKSQYDTILSEISGIIYITKNNKEITDFFSYTTSLNELSTSNPEEWIDNEILDIINEAVFQKLWQGSKVNDAFHIDYNKGYTASLYKRHIEGTKASHWVNTGKTQNIIENISYNPGYLFQYDNNQVEILVDISTTGVSSIEMVELFIESEKIIDLQKVSETVYGGMLQIDTKLVEKKNFEVKITDIDPEFSTSLTKPFYIRPVISGPVVIISEMCDIKNDYSTNRYIEIANIGDVDVDLTGWTLKAVANYGSSRSYEQNWLLDGVIQAGDAVVCGKAGNTYADFTINTWSGMSSWNGDGDPYQDGAILYNEKGDIIDYAVGETKNYFTDSSLHRSLLTSEASMYFKLSEWEVKETSDIGLRGSSPGEYP